MIENQTLFQAATTGEALNVLLSSGRKKPLSIRELSRRLGYQSDRALGMAHKGARPMSQEMLENLASHFHLSEKQNKFLHLVNERTKLAVTGGARSTGKRLDRARISQGGSTKATRIDAELLKLRTSTDIYDVLTSNELEKLEAWYAIPILAMITRAGQASEAALLSAFEGRISEKELKQAVEAHVKLGRIERMVGPAGEALLQDAKPARFITTRPDIPSRSVRRIHENQLERAKATLEEQSVLDREFMTFSIAIDPALLPELKKKIREAVLDLTVQTTAPPTSPTTEIYQLACQFYRQTRPMPAK
jgi:hypothetical protein